MRCWCLRLCYHRLSCMWLKFVRPARGLTSCDSAYGVNREYRYTRPRFYRLRRSIISSGPLLCMLLDFRCLLSLPAVLDSSRVYLQPCCLPPFHSPSAFSPNQLLRLQHWLQAQRYHPRSLNKLVVAYQTNLVRPNCRKMLSTTSKSPISWRISNQPFSKRV